MLTFLFEFVVFSVALIFACMCHCQLHAFVASLLLQWLSRIRESLSPNTMAAASAVGVGGGDEDMSSVSGDYSGESAFSRRLPHATVKPSIQGLVGSSTILPTAHRHLMHELIIFVIFNQ